MEIIRALRLGEFDALIGINLLREGLDIPEVSLVAILDADKEGLFRSETSLVQTIGRAARNANGRVIMFADTVTRSMKNAIDETNRRRKVQTEYNTANGIVPKTIIKDIHDVIDLGKRSEESKAIKKMSHKDKEKLIEKLTAEMREASRNLEFERAAYLRDKIRELQILKTKGEK
jgi:excinuclease ABC subunit B